MRKETVAFKHIFRRSYEKEVYYMLVGHGDQHPVLYVPQMVGDTHRRQIAVPYRLDEKTVSMLQNIDRRVLSYSQDTYLVEFEVIPLVRGSYVRATALTVYGSPHSVQVAFKDRYPIKHLPRIHRDGLPFKYENKPHELTNGDLFKIAVEDPGCLKTAAEIKMLVRDNIQIVSHLDYLQSKSITQDMWASAKPHLTIYDAIRSFEDKPRSFIDVRRDTSRRIPFWWSQRSEAFYKLMDQIDLIEAKGEETK